MTATIKKKLCWNCEGRVAQVEENCPFCGVYLNGTLDMHGRVLEDEEEEEHDPYSNNSQTQDIHPPAYIPEGHTEQVAIQENILVEAEPSLSPKAEILPLALLAVGSIFLVFSLVLLLFSQDGILKLQWDASLWFVYLAVSLPTLFFGFKYFRRL